MATDIFEGSLSASLTKFVSLFAYFLIIKAILGRISRNEQVDVHISTWYTVAYNLLVLVAFFWMID